MYFREWIGPQWDIASYHKDGYKQNKIPRPENKKCGCWCGETGSFVYANRNVKENAVW